MDLILQRIEVHLRYMVLNRLVARLLHFQSNFINICPYSEDVESDNFGSVRIRDTHVEHFSD